MSKVTSSINALTSGEWSPKGKGRFDLAKYASGASKMENFIINQLGGAAFRPGTRYLAETKDSSKKSRLLPFQYQADQDYVMEMGDLYFRLYENDGDSVVDTSADAYTKLLLHSNGLDGSKEIQDSGNTGHVVTQVGTAQLSSAQTKFGICSLLLDGNSDYLTVPNHANWNQNGNTWTYEGWFRFTSVAASIPFFVHKQDVDNTSALWWQQSTNKLIFNHLDGGADRAYYNCTFAPIINTWYHIAIVRNSSTFYMFINGTSQAVTITTAFGTLAELTGNLEIGRWDSIPCYLSGYVEEVRISDTARWTASFTPSTSAYTSDANTLLLLHMESLDESSVTTPKIPTFVGTAQLDTAQYKSLTGYTTTRASILLDGDSDYLTVPYSADWDLFSSTTDATIDLQVKHADHAGTEIYMCQYEDAGNYWELGHIHGTGVYLSVYSAAGEVIAATGTEIADTNWHHIALVKDGTTYTIYVDGVPGTPVTDASTDSFLGTLRIGCRNADNYFQGWIDEIRVSNGVARWSADFSLTLPAAEWALTPTTTTEITTPYLEADIFEVQYAQHNDILYLVHPDYAPRKLSRTSATAFTLAEVSFVRGPFLDANTTAITITPSVATGTGITLTASDAIFDTDHIGSLWRINKDSTHGAVVKITAYASTTSVTADVQAEPDGVAGNIGGTGAYTDWAEGAFSAYRGYPSAIAFHEQRLYYANTTHEPQKFWGSTIAAYDNFSNGYGAAGAEATVADTDAVNFEVATEQRNAIKWLSSGNKALIIGTNGGTFSASSGDASAPIATDNIMVNRDTNYGVAAIMPKRISSLLYYVQRDLLRLRELSYSWAIDSTIATDMTLLAEHILRDGSGVVDLDHQQSPNDRIWCVRSDGEIAVLTRNPEQEVMGWNRIVAGDDATGNGLFESVCVIPKSDSDDQVWVIVKRVINGSTKRFIEFFMPEEFDEDWDSVNCDCSLTLDYPSTITGVTIASDLILYTAGDVALAAGDQIKITGVVGTTEINGIFKISATSFTLGTSFKITTLADVAVDFAAYGAWISGGEIRKMVTNISGLTHLNGETVVVQTDGYIPSTETYTVTGGAITLPDKAAVVHVGLPFSGTIQLLKLSDGSPTGTGQTQQRRIYKGTLRLHRSQGLSLGRTTTTLDSLNYNDETDSEALFTGDMEKVFQTTWYDADEILISQTKPLPAHILAIIFESEVE